jgi:hypothetical protein
MNLFLEEWKLPNKLGDKQVLDDVSGARRSMYAAMKNV